MSRTKKSRKQGKLTQLLADGPSKRELLTDPESLESRRKRALEKKRRSQRSIKRDPDAAAQPEGTANRKRVARLKNDPAKVAAESEQLINDAKSDA